MAQARTQLLMDATKGYVVSTYVRQPIVLVKGAGSQVWDSDGKEYIDCFPGFGTAGLGHCHPAVVQAVQMQSERLIHVANNFYNERQGIVAQKLIERSFPGKCFFSNSGAEANEAAIKIARRFGHASGRYEIITMLNSFHGRTVAALTATGQKKYQEGFDPLVPGFRHVAFNDITALSQEISDKTVAVVIELIQGEGGIYIADKAYVQAIRRLCDEKGLLLIIDEVQTGCGRTGQLFCFQHYGVVPDIMTLAKAIGGGLPLGVTIAGRTVCDVLTPGTHASTYGGNPLVCAAALAVLETIEKENLLQQVQDKGALLYSLLAALQKKYSIIKEIRGIGLMLGIELTMPGAEIVRQCLDKGLIVNCTHDTVIRFLPAMTISREQLMQAVEIFETVIKNI